MAGTWPFGAAMSVLLSLSETRFLVVTLLSVVDLPESSKDASAGVNGAFQTSFWPVHCA
jgi:hypothetical protein